MRIRTISLLSIVVAAVGLCLAVVGPQAEAAGATVADVTDAQVQSLLDMAPAERRSHIKSLEKGERAALWMKLRQVQAERNGKVDVVRYSELSPMAVTDSPAPAWANRAPGTIVYDDGFPTIGFGGGALVGNRFDTHTGFPNVTNPGTVSTIQVLLVPGPANTTSSAGFVLHGPQTTGGGATALFSTFTVATGVIDSVSFTGMGVTYTGSSFFVLFGDFASVYIPVFGTGSTMSQGHHGVVGYTGGMGPDITGTFDFGGALNSFVRATGNIVPVELMSFDVE